MDARRAEEARTTPVIQHMADAVPREYLGAAGALRTLALVAKCHLRLQVRTSS